MLLSMSCHLPCSPSLCINLSHQRPSLHHQKSKPEGADGWRGWGMWQFVHLGYHRDEVGSWPSVQGVLPPRLNMPRSKNILLSTAVVMLVFTKRTWLICSTIMLLHLIICCHFRLPKFTWYWPWLEQRVKEALRSAPRRRPLPASRIWRPQVQTSRFACRGVRLTRVWRKPFSKLSSLFFVILDADADPSTAIDKAKKTNWSILQFRFQNSNRANS